MVTCQPAQARPEVSLPLQFEGVSGGLGCRIDNCERFTNNKCSATVLDDLDLLDGRMSAHAQYTIRTTPRICLSLARRVNFLRTRPEIRALTHLRHRIEDRSRFVPPSRAHLRNAPTRIFPPGVHAETRPRRKRVYAYNGPSVDFSTYSHRRTRQTLTYRVPCSSRIRFRISETPQQNLRPLTLIHRSVS